ncbi:hypothetical protein Fmac_030502 [Flemingia macrophylla]|uniref:Uncharacterized protein n=1 Tax=Flemingia macrophylla TaxID=520843 RepID=A0ABD1KZD9_9FABA
MENNVEKMTSCIKVIELKNGKQIIIPGLNMDEIKQQRNMIVTVSAAPTTQVSLKKSSSEKRNCLCSPTTHAGSFRCRHHRSAGMRHATSIGSNLSSLSPKQFQ